MLWRHDYYLHSTNTVIPINSAVSDKLPLALSRLPLPVEPAKLELEPELVLLAEHLADSPVMANDIRISTECDTKLSRVLYTKDGLKRVTRSSNHTSPNVWNCLHFRVVFCGGQESSSQSQGEKLSCRSSVRGIQASQM